MENIDLAHLAELGVIELSKDVSGEAKMALSVASSEKKEKRAPKPRTTAPQKEKSVPQKREVAEEREDRISTTNVPCASIPEATLATLTPEQKAILEAIPDDGTLSTDAIFALEYPHANIMAALTMLEIMGLIQKLPGSLYKKA